MRKRSVVINTHPVSNHSFPAVVVVNIVFENNPCGEAESTQCYQTYKYPWFVLANNNIDKR